MKEAKAINEAVGIESIFRSAQPFLNVCTKAHTGRNREQLIFCYYAESCGIAYYRGSVPTFSHPTRARPRDAEGTTRILASGRERAVETISQNGGSNERGSRYYIVHFVQYLSYDVDRFPLKFVPRVTKRLFCIFCILKGNETPSCMCWIRALDGR